jgi:colicin import membrane protein
MSTDLQESATKLPDGYPFHIGSRLMHYVDDSGKPNHKYIPLTLEDFIHPQENDRFMILDQHWTTVTYIRQALELANRDTKGFRVFSYHRIDWQVDGILPHGPDVAVFENFWQDWDPMKGTLPVKDMGANPIAVIEVTSESTRSADFGKKYIEYAEAGIPYYLIVDYHGPKDTISLYGYRLKNGVYKEMRKDPELGYSIPRTGVFFRLENDILILSDVDGNDIPTNLEMSKMLENEKQRAEQEKQRADGLAREVAELKARLGLSQ